MTNRFLKILCSIPIILILLYFIPFLGVCFIILRFFIYHNKKRISIPILLIGVGILIYIPKGLYDMFGMIKFDSSVLPYFNEIINSNFYQINFINYGKLLISVGVIFLIISFMIDWLFNKFKNFIKSYICLQEKRDYEISQKNDFIMKEKQEKARNTSVVYCPYCGADNILTAKSGTCKYCRRQIQGKE